MTFFRTHKWFTLGILGILVIILWLLAPWTWTKPDYSTQLHTGYRFFGVPITKNLANSLLTCASYKRSYSENIGTQLWTNRLGYKTFFAMRPGNENNCIIKSAEREGFGRPYTTTVKISIPRALAHRVGELFLAAFSPTPDNQEKIKHFSRLIMGYEAFGDDTIFAAGHFETFTHHVEEYLEQWDKDTYQKEYERPERERKQEEKLCQKLQKQLQDMLQQNPQFAQLSTNEKLALARQVKKSVSYPHRLGRSGGVTGYNPSKDEGTIEECSELSCCLIKYNSKEIVSAQFTPQEPSSLYSQLPAGRWVWEDLDNLPPPHSPGAQLACSYSECHWVE